MLSFRKFPAATLFSSTALRQCGFRIMETENVSEREAKRLMKKVDKERASYHNYYTKIKWGHPSNYELVINTGRTGIDKAVKVIESYLEE